MRTPALVLAALLIGTAACGRDQAPTETPRRTAATESGVRVARVDGGVRVVNHTGRPIYFVVWNPHWLALLGQCTSAMPDCPTLAPGHAATVAERDIGGYHPAVREAVVYWWHGERDAAGTERPGELHEVTVPL